VILAGGRGPDASQTGVDERRPDGGERFGPGEVALAGHHPVDIGTDFIDEPLPAGRAGFCRADIGRGETFVVDEPHAVGAGAKRPGRAWRSLRASVTQSCPQTGQCIPEGWGAWYIGVSCGLFGLFHQCREPAGVIDGAEHCLCKERQRHSEEEPRDAEHKEPEEDREDDDERGEFEFPLRRVWGEPGPGEVVDDRNPGGDGHCAGESVTEPGEADGWDRRDGRPRNGM